MKLAISGQQLARVKSLRDILEILRKYEVKGIELWPANIPLKGEAVKYQEHRYEGRDIEQAKETLSDYGIEVACITVSGAFSPEMTSDPGVYSESVCYALEVAKEFGAGVVNHYCANWAPGHHSDINNYLKVIEPAVKRAEELGVTMVLEPEAHDASGTPDGMLRILKSVNSDRFKTNFDPCNYYHASQEAFPYAYDILKEYIGYVHLKNGCIFRVESGHIEQSRGTVFGGVYEPNEIYYPVLSEGAVNIDGLLRRLQKDGYDGYCTLEPHTTPENIETYYERDTAYLRGLGFFTTER